MRRFSYYQYRQKCNFCSGFQHSHLNAVMSLSMSLFALFFATTYGFVTKTCWMQNFYYSACAVRETVINERDPVPLLCVLYPVGVYARARRRSRTSSLQLTPATWTSRTSDRACRTTTTTSHLASSCSMHCRPARFVPPPPPAAADVTHRTAPVYMHR